MTCFGHSCDIDTLLLYLYSFSHHPEDGHIKGQNMSMITTLTNPNECIQVFKDIVLPVVLYGCETWSLTLREERRLRVFENRALRRIFGCKRDKVTGEWRKLHNEELNDLYFSPNVV